MRSTFVFKYPNVQVNLWQLHGVRVGAVEVEAFIVLLPIALVGINHVLDPALGLGVDAIPAGGELDVDFQFCNIQSQLMGMFSLIWPSVHVIAYPWI